ncbi:C-type lectin domain family 10 member A-like [Mercenaria mercenaria]|uniref:C-type lectin domain family 10 member A-like n=1 Tax=Mercenaria mercenaria TaxID=6596 RepID=UPI00234F4887|nr:C-type lectin domain family 10 member A-like [Mercenaria mercenaria]
MMMPIGKQFVIMCVFIFSARCSHVSQTKSNVAGCRDNWVTYDGSCYLFGHHMLTFTEAEHFCRLYNSHLVHIDNSFENAFLKDHIRYTINPNDIWWIGLTDEVIENDWRWLDTDTRPAFTGSILNNNSFLIPYILKNVLCLDMSESGAFMKIVFVYQ